MQTYNKTQKIILTGVMTALVSVATMVISIPVPFTNGYIHLGDSMVFLSVLILGWKYGAFAAGVGSAMADMLLGYVHWAPWTLCIKGNMAILMGLFIQHCMTSKKNTAIGAVVAGGLWLVFNFAANKAVAFQAASNGQALFEDAGVTDMNGLAEFLSAMESKLMLGALLIPVILLIVSFLIGKREHIIIPIYQILAMTAAGMFMVFGYYMAGGILYGNFAVAAFSIPANIIQFVGGFFVASLISAALCKTPARNLFAYKTIVSLK